MDKESTSKTHLSSYGDIQSKNSYNSLNIETRISKCEMRNPKHMNCHHGIKRYFR